ncbi:hypothetical protein Cgig2_016671 [Carnegiea gigantea]|uniref:AAA+ ATPase domain-containing protein n=1 Tax=Carnegiea gigantea TaxID=171969 RepID=A0A9Q1KY73_9CARY|nr:hypothetical protein Cgig2_016671 [Carnegiea gigantea]
MAAHCTMSSSVLQPSLLLRGNAFKSRNFKYPFGLNPRISCQLHKTPQDDDDDNNENEENNHALELLKLSVTLTVVATSLPQPVWAAKVTEKKLTAKKATEALTPEQMKSWSQGLPVVRDRLPYSDLLNLKEEGKVKHIIKPPGAGLRQKPECVLVVLDDSRVFRTVLPSVEVNPKFWSKWYELNIDSLCVNAYSPPVKKPEIPSPYLGFLTGGPIWMYSSFFKSKPQSKKALELKGMREELKRLKIQEKAKMTKEIKAMEERVKQEQKMEKRKRKRELQMRKYKESLREAQMKYQRVAANWRRLARDENVVTVFGLLFFFIFYQTVVLSYRRQRKDYEDRMKIEKAEAEERKKMKELERSMQGLEGDDDEEEGKSGEQDPYTKMAKQFMKSGARVRRVRSKRPPQYLDMDANVKFSDVAGLGKIRLELEEIVKFFTHAEMYRRRGVKIPGGILLCGPPGVGKTLLAKAVAGEAGVNFFSISASQFVEIYVGVGSSRVRALYQEAKENAPAVVFIDELDAVGRERGIIKGSGGQERDATLNQLLVCLDGFEGRGEVITIASTNRPDILDPALVRPGRFDRKIHIPKPSLQGRVEILQVHARKKPMADDVDYVAVAGMTNGMVGAELANIIEVAALNMLRDGRTEVLLSPEIEAVAAFTNIMQEVELQDNTNLVRFDNQIDGDEHRSSQLITTEDLLQAVEMEERGMLHRRDRSPEMWKRIALNEAAQAVAAVNFPDFRNIEFLNIAPRAGTELGYVRFKIDRLKFTEGMLSRQSVLDHIAVQLAPRAADELWHGEGQEIDLEALRIVDMCYERVKKRNQKLLEAVVDELVQTKHLSKEDFFHLVDLHGSLEPVPPSVLDITLEKRSEFQRMLKKQKEASGGHDDVWRMQRPCTTMKVSSSQIYSCSSRGCLSSTVENSAHLQEMAQPQIFDF